MCLFSASLVSILHLYSPVAMSENYVVFIEQPIKMDLLKIVTCKLRGKALSEGIYWDPKQDTMFHLVDKKTGQVGGGCRPHGEGRPPAFTQEPWVLA